MSCDTDKSLAGLCSRYLIYLRCYYAFFGTVVFIVRSSDLGSGGFVDEIQLIHWMGVGARLNNSCFISIERHLSVCVVR